MSKRLVYSSAAIIFGVIGWIGFTARPVVAFPEFKAVFKSKYVKPDSKAENDVALAAAFEKASCLTCHGGADKKIRNDYGKQLEKLIGKTDKKDTAKIQAAMDTVAKLKSKPSDDASPTFGEKIASGKLPAAK